MKHPGTGRRVGILAAAMLALVMTAVPAEKKTSREEGEYRIYVSGQEVGVEKYVIASTADGVTSSSKLVFRNPGAGPKKISLESKLEMNPQLVPKKYELKSDVDGQEGKIAGDFAPNQAIFDFSGNGVSVRHGLLVGERYTILDTNIFHQFTFLARLFKYDRGKTAQTFEVLIPQEKDTGIIKISEMDKETIVVAGKKIRVTRLVLDSGSLQIQLWVDGDHVTQKISLPDKGIEVLHGK